MRLLGYKGPIIGVTGNVLREDVEHFVAQGANEVVGKPLRSNAVQQVMKRYSVDIGPLGSKNPSMDASASHRMRERVEYAGEIVM